jgi:hypothetical protein
MSLSTDRLIAQCVVKGGLSLECQGLLLSLLTSSREGGFSETRMQSMGHRYLIVLLSLANKVSSSPGGAGKGRPGACSYIDPFATHQKRRAFILWEDASLNY